MKLKLHFLLSVILVACHTAGFSQLSTFEGKISNQSVTSSLKTTDLPKIDSNAIKSRVVKEVESYLQKEMNRLEASENVGTYKRMFSDVYGSISDLRNYDKQVMSYFPDSSSFKVDSSQLIQKAEELAIQQLSKNEEIGSATSLLREQESEFSQLKSNFNDPKGKMNELKSNPSKWMDYAPEEAVSNAISSVRELTEKQKRKFRSFSTDETVSKVKSNSLENSPLKERFLFECDFSTQIDKESTIDLLPTIGWKINRGWSLAGGLSYRVFLSVDQNSIYSQQEVKGYRFFSDYRIWRSLFVRGEFESLNVAREGDKGSENYWSDAASIGAGNVFDFSDKIQGRLVIQYNLLHTESSPNNRPFTIRFGLSI